MTQVSSSQPAEKNDSVAGQGERGHLVTRRDLAQSEGGVHTLVSALRGEPSDVAGAMLERLRSSGRCTCPPATQSSLLILVTGGRCSSQGPSLQVPRERDAAPPCWFSVNSPLPWSHPNLEALVQNGRKIPETSAKT